MTYDKLIDECAENGVEVHELDIINKGLYADKIIAISKNIDSVSKKCVLAEELGHYHANIGNILDQNDVGNIKQENKARKWAFEKLLPVTVFVDAFNARCRSREDIIEFLDVTEEFLLESLDYYKKKYGLYYYYGDYLVIFEPLGVVKQFN